MDFLKRFCHKKHPLAVPKIISRGAILCGWIFAQVLMVKEINPLHVIMFLVGVILIVSGYLLKNNK
jgi:hypothetical protein